MLGAMSEFITSLLTQKGLSARKAGERVHTLWKIREPENRDLPDPKSIGPKLGQLQRGQLTWWENHPQALAALAEILGCTVAELRSASQGPAAGIEFAEFAELPPLGANEEPCPVNERGWLWTDASYTLLQGVHVWYFAPRGAGKSLIIQYLKQRAVTGSGYSSYTARSLAEAALHSDPKVPLVVEVEIAEPKTDLTGLQELTARRTNTCILAPFRRPKLDENENARWADIEFHLGPSWRERLIRWAHGRLPEPTQLDVDGLLDWLADVDPQVKLFSTPGVLLPIVAWCYRKHRAPKQKETLDVLADEYLTRHFHTASQHNPYLRKSGPKVVDALVRRRITSVEIPHAPLSRDMWIKLMPEELVPNHSDDEVERQVKGILRERSSDGRKKKEAEAIAMLTAARAPEIIDRLVDCGVLATQANGNLDVHPPWVRRGAERRAWMHELLQEKPQQWGLLAADSSRKREVDAILDELAPSMLVDLAKRAVNEPLSELGVVAAIEALFAAFARRILLMEWRPVKAQIPTLQALGKCQADLLDRIADFWNDGLPGPVTRMDIHESWYSICRFEAWVFSLSVPRPSSVQQRLNWVFPGWAENLRLADAPKQLDYPHASTRLPEHVRNTVELVPWVREVLKLCRDNEIPQDVSEVFLPWLIIDGHSSGNRVQPEQWNEMMKWGSTCEQLAAVLTKESIEVQRRIVLEAWPYVKKQHNQEHPVWALIEQQRRAPKFFELFVKHLPLSAFEAELRNAKLENAELQGLEKLPLEFRRAVLRAIAARLENSNRSTPYELDKFMKTLGLEDVDLLVQFVGYHYSVAYAAAARVFVIDQERALQETQAALEQGEKAMTIWFYQAPTSLLPTLVQMLEAHEGDNVSRLRHWLATNIAKAGALAPRVFQLLQRASAAT